MPVPLPRLHSEKKGRAKYDYHKSAIFEHKCPQSRILEPIDEDEDRLSVRQLPRNELLPLPLIMSGSLACPDEISLLIAFSSHNQSNLLLAMSLRFVTSCVAGYDGSCD